MIWYLILANMTEITMRFSFVMLRQKYWLHFKLSNFHRFYIFLSVWTSLISEHLLTPSFSSHEPLRTFIQIFSVKFGSPNNWYSSSLYMRLHSLLIHIAPTVTLFTFLSKTELIILSSDPPCRRPNSFDSYIFVFLCSWGNFSTWLKRKRHEEARTILLFTSITC